MRIELKLLALVVVVALFFVSGYSLLSGGFDSVTGRSTSQALLCVNQPPNISASCPESFNQSTRLVNNSFVCNVVIDDPDGDKVDLFVMNEPPEGVWFRLINEYQLFLDARHEGVGIHGIIINAYDDSPCENSFSEYEYSFEVLDINDPPDYILTIPDVELRIDFSISRFSLFDHFVDVDGDFLNFSARGYFASDITINPQTGDVLIKGRRCGSDYVLFRATDPFGLYADSHPVKITVICPEDTSPGQSTGGGEGGSNPEIPCVSQWRCNDWSECFMNETRFMRCVDLNGCNFNDYMRFFWEECEYPWPPEEEELIEEEEVIEEECVDCDVVPEVEMPSYTPDQEQSLLFIIIMGVIIFAALLLLKFFHRQLSSLFSSIGWFLTRHHQKQILLSIEQKDRMLKELVALEQQLRLYPTSPRDMADQVTTMSRRYLSLVFDVPVIFDPQEVRIKISKTITIGSLRKVFGSFLDKLLRFESQPLDNTSFFELKLCIEEVRQLVFQSSKVSSDDMIHDLTELEVKGSAYHKVRVRLYNAYLALQSERTDAAKDHYRAILVLYEALVPAQKSLVFPDMSRLFFEIKYQLAWV